jgi:CHAD domain-containing protein
MAKARKIPYFNPDQQVKICLRKILHTRFNEMYSYEKGTMAGEDIEYLHDMRVSSRRVQAAMKIFRGVFPGRKFRHVYMNLKTLIRALGEVRHYDVSIERLIKYREELNEHDRKAFDLLIIRQNTVREQKRKVLTDTMKQLEKAGFKEEFHKFITVNL